jgi:hypothetical protein
MNLASHRNINIINTWVAHRVQWDLSSLLPPCCGKEKKVVVFSRSTWHLPIYLSADLVPFKDWLHECPRKQKKGKKMSLSIMTTS